MIRISLPTLTTLLAAAIFAPALAQAWRFEQHGLYPVDAGADRVVIADFDGDGVPDAATGGSRLTFLPGDGSGGFGPRETLLPVGSIRFLAAGDLLGNRSRDVLAVSSDGQVAIFDGGNGLRLARSIKLDTRLGGAVIADFNSDGRNDFAITEYNKHRVLVWRAGRGDRFIRSTFGTGQHPYAPVAVDVTADKHVDLVLSNLEWHRDGCLNGCFSVLTNDGRGDFGRPRRFAGPRENRLRNITALAAGRVDPGPTQDLVMAAGGKIVIRRGLGNGRFSDERGYYLSDSRIYTIAVADLNGDRRPEVIAPTGRRLWVLANTGDPAGSLERRPALRLEGAPYDLGVRDLNDDARIDLTLPLGFASSLLPQGPALEVLLNRPG